MPGLRYERDLSATFEIKNKVSWLNLKLIAVIVFIFEQSDATIDSFYS